MGRIENKVAIVTGGALGIGKSACEVLAREGAKVAVTDILDNEGKQTAEEIKKNGGIAEFWHLDHSIEEQVTEVFSEVRNTFGGIDILVNNAGISGVNKPTHEIDQEDWDNLMAINVRGPFLCTKHAIPEMKKVGGGSIINLSSIYGIISNADVPAYHASKGALRLMTKTDALLYAQDNIRVNSVHPGFIWTPMVENFAKESGDVEAVKQNLRDLHPLGHLGEAEDIANGILFLASDESKFMTGSELVIDGGYTAR